MRLLLIAFMLLATLATAQTVSEHNEQHTAEGAARELLKADGCLWTKTTRVEQFRVQEAEGNAVRILAKELLVVCVDLPEDATVTLSWAAPTTRANGDALPPAEIAGYEIYYYSDGSDEVTVAVSAATEHSLALAAGNYTFAIAAVDTQGLVSARSDPVLAPVNL